LCGWANLPVMKAVWRNAGKSHHATRVIRETKKLARRISGANVASVLLATLRFTI